ncbi:MAG: endopeptidase La [Thermoleophilia bacterium]
MPDTPDTPETPAFSPLSLPLIPLEDALVLPGMALSVDLASPEANAAVDEIGDDRKVVLVPRVDGRFARIGVIAVLEGEPAMLPGGSRGVTLRALHRAELGRAEAAGGALRIEVTERPDPEADETAQELAREYRGVVEEILEARGNRGVIAMLRQVDEPGALADTAGFSPDLSYERKLELLETIDVAERLTKVTGWLRDVLAEIAVRERIREDVNEGMEKSQREFLLRRQLDAIRKELGELEGEEGDEIARYRTKLDESKLSDEARKEATRELDRLEAGAQGPESSTIRTYLDTLLELPWGEYSEESGDVKGARAILDADHAGLDDVKERIVEYLAVRKFRRERDIEDGKSGVILALVGPPGVGKTSLGESIAHALGREFVRVSLGGVRDEAEIRGHRRTYVGAMPGRFVRALRDAGTMNPVILLDEVDKLGADFRGDPAAALLEVLDPAQNSTFRDHYLDVEVDLSQVLFIATANMADQIPYALYDRLEVLELDGYTDDEKVAIATGYLVPRQRTKNGLLDDEATISEDAIRKVLREHTREAGVRTLERTLGTLLRKAATRLAAGEATAPIAIGVEQVDEDLGRAKFHDEIAERTGVAGVATGLAVTSVGGDVLFVEASSHPGSGSPTLTGQLGDVMRESATIALSHVRSNAAHYGIDSRQFEDRQFHLHVPAGAVPKDGPSAGVTMSTAVVSLLTGRHIRPNVAMTGEVTLRGRVLPVGGIKQKVLAAHRAGITDVIIPKRNEGDLEDVPAEVLAELTIHPVATLEEALAVSLEPAVHWEELAVS